MQRAKHGEVIVDANTCIERRATATATATKLGKNSKRTKLAEGRPELFTELPAKVQGLKPVIDSQAWVINKLHHTLGDGGLVTDVELEMKLDELGS